MSDADCTAARRDLLDCSRGRLTAEARRRLERHLEGCPACRALEQRERALDAALSALPERPAPATLEQRLRASLRAAPAATPASRARLRRSWAVAMVTALLALAVGLAIGSRSAGLAAEPLLTEAVNDHLRVLYAEHAVEIESGGIHQVKPWFEGRLDFAPQLGFEGDDEFRLTGGAVGYFIDRKAAVFVFKHRLHVVTLFEFRSDGLPWPRVPTTTVGRLRGTLSESRGFRALAFRDGDLGYALVSDIEPDALMRLAEKLSERR